MATAFPLSTYPLDDRTDFVDEMMTLRDMLDDGAMRIRTVGANTYRILRCEFSPMYGVDGATFAAYMRTNRATEFDVAYEGVTYRGYLWSEVRLAPFEGDAVRASFDFRGLVV